MVRILISINELAGGKCLIEGGTDEGSGSDREKMYANAMSKGMEVVLEQMGMIEKEALSVVIENPSEELRRRVVAKFDGRRE